MTTPSRVFSVDATCLSRIAVGRGIVAEDDDSANAAIIPARATRPEAAPAVPRSSQRVEVPTGARAATSPVGAGGFIAIEVAVGGRRSSRANAVHQIIAGPQVGVGTVALARCRRGNRRHLCARLSRTRPVKAAPAAAMAVTVSALTILCLTREYPFLSTSRPSEFPRSSHSSSTCILCQLTASGLLHVDGKI